MTYHGQGPSAGFLGDAVLGCSNPAPLNRALAFAALGTVALAWGFAFGIKAGERVTVAAHAPAGRATLRREPSPPRAEPARIASPAAALPDACRPLTRPDLPVVMTIGDDPPIPEIADAKGALAGFYERLARRARGEDKDHLRIGLYGDSHHSRDFVSGQLRRRLQALYGDGGHGFVALARPWKGSYLHLDVEHSAWPGWSVFDVTTDTTPDGRYGHAFIAAQSKGGAPTWVSTASDGAPVGRSVSRFEVSYVRGPWFGEVSAQIDGKVAREIDTYASTFSAGFTTIEVPDGPHKLVLVPHGPRTVRLLGAVLERDAPGVVVDGLGVGSMNCRCIIGGDEALFAQTLERRNYDLLVVHLGTNLFAAKEIRPCMTKLIRRLRRTLPDTPVLILSPVDLLGWTDPPKSASYILAARDQLEKVAAENGEPFWDFHAAMGGPASLARFRKLGMNIDGVHLDQRGSAYMGDRLFYALVKGFLAYLDGHPRAGCG